MRAVIGRLLQIDTRDRNILLALLMQAAGSGVFIAVFDLTANTLFLDRFGTERIPLAFMISGGVGMFLISLYHFIQSRMEVHSFGLLNLLLVIAVTVILIAGPDLFQKKNVEFSLFVFMGPLTLMTLLGFWSTVKGIFQSGKVHMFSGMIEAGLIGGMVLGFFAGPLLVEGGTGVFNLLSVGLAGLLAALGSQLYLLLKKDKRRVPYRFASPGTGPFALFSHRYTGLMAAFVILGVGVSILLHYSFLWVSHGRFTGSRELVDFFGFFFGAMMILAWTTKRYLFGWIKKRFGIAITLLVSPLLLIILTMVTAAAAESFGYTGGAATFSYFFMLVILSRMIGGSLKGSMEDPSMKIMYQTLDRRERYLTQRSIEGVLHETAVFATGFFLASVVLISFVEIIHVIYILLILLLVWISVGLALYRSYRRFLKVSLESERLKEVADRSVEDLVKVDLERTAFPVETMEFNPYFFHYASRENLMLLLNHSHAGVRERVWGHLLRSSPGLPDLTLNQMLVKEKEPAVKKRIRELGQRRLKSKLGLQEAFIKERLDRFLDEKPEDKISIGDAFRSGEKNEIYAALYQVAQEKDLDYLPEVVTLLRNQDTNLRSVAISTAAFLESDGMGEKLVEFLDHPELYMTAWSAVVKQGEGVLDDLETAFHRPGASILLQKRIVTAMAAIGGPRSSQLLLGKLDYHHREIFHITVKNLYEKKFVASEIQAATIQNAIFRLVRTGTWNLAAKISVTAGEPEDGIIKAIEDELGDVNELIMMLLAMIYDRRPVQRIQMNLADRDPGSRAVAIELLDLLVRAPLKELLITYFEEMSVREKIDKLQLLFPVEIFPFKTLLIKILNRDGMQLGHFIRICVLELMGRRKEFFDEQQILAQGFHPDRKIRETAAQLLRKNDPERYSQVSARPDFPDNTFPDHDDPARWYIETVLGLADWEIFMNVGLNSLFKLVSGLQSFDEELLSGGDYVVLARSVEEGSFSPLSSGIAIIAAHQPEIMEQIRYLGAGGKCTAYLIEREMFIELLFDERSLLHVFCAGLNKDALSLV